MGPNISSEELKRYMWMRTPQQALDVIADIIDMQEDVAVQDAWLVAVRKLGFVDSDITSFGRVDVDDDGEARLEEVQRSREYGYTHPTPDDYDASLDDPNYEEEYQ